VRLHVLQKKTWSTAGVLVEYQLSTEQYVEYEEYGGVPVEYESRFFPLGIFLLLDLPIAMVRRVAVLLWFFTIE